jgi:REP element-mobilizing transposase RayT
MGRPHRIDQAGAIHHVTARSNSGADIFRTDTDASVFLALFARAVADQGWRCTAYCLMPSHYHVLLETPRPTLSTGMHWLNATYARLFNSAHDRRGHVFQKRFHSEIVSRDAHLLEAMRYIPLNPVRAGLVEEPERWTWSSYRATAGLCRSPMWFASDRALGAFGANILTARSAYRAFVREGDRSPRTRETQTEMARRLGVSQATISRMLRRRDE